MFLLIEVDRVVVHKKIPHNLFFLFNKLRCMLMFPVVLRVVLCNC